MASTQTFSGFSGVFRSYAFNLKFAQNSKWMQTIRVRTTQNVFIDYPLASVADRIFGYVLDRLILFFYTVAVAAVFAEMEMETWYIWLIVVGFPWLFYSLAFEIAMNGQTPGKRVLKIKVVRLDGTPPGIGDYLMRWICGFVDFYILGGLVAVVTIALGGKGQRLGDIAAGTSVVRLKEHDAISAKSTFISQEESEYTPTFPEVVSLTEKDIELVQRALETNRDQGNIKPVMIVTEKIKALLKIQSDMPPVKFLYTIVKDYQNITAGS
jgi:uncharacterized RDD family membrane protein YckC